MAALAVVALSATPARAGLAEWVDSGSIEHLTDAQRKAITNALWESTRDDLAPYRVGAGTATNYYPERVGSIVRQNIQTLPPSAPGAQSVQSGVVRTGWRAQLLPKLRTGLSAGRRIAPRALGAAGGAYVLWEIGSNVFGGTRTVPIRVGATTMTGTGTDFVWSDEGACVSGTGGITYGATVSGCTTGGTTNYGGLIGTMSWRNPAVPANVLIVRWQEDGNDRYGTNCGGYTNATYAERNHDNGTAFAPTLRVSGHYTYATPPTVCTRVLPTQATHWENQSGSFNDSQTTDRVLIHGHNTDPEDASCSETSASCHYNSLNENRLTAYYLDVDTRGEVIEPLRTGDHPDWSGVPSNDDSRISTPGAAAPAAADAKDDVLDGLSEPAAQPLRNQIAYVIGTTEGGYGAEGDAYWNESANNPPPPQGGPAYGDFTMPTCRGGTVAACTTALAAAGHTGTVTTTVLQPLQADVTLPADAVVVTDPAQGATVTTETPIEITVNPAPASMPRAVPQPQPGETYEQYVQRLVDLGLVGDVVTLTDATLSPDHGPNEVVGVEPDVGTLLAPGDTVTVTANPPTAPVPGAAGGCDPWVEPAIDFDPLVDLDPGNVFPFAIPFWIGDVLDEWVGEPVTPSWDFHFPFGGDGDNFTIDLAMFDPYMPAIRQVLFALALASMLWLFVGLAYGSIGGGRSSADD